MVYFDYAATTPVDHEVAKSYELTQHKFFANPDSLHYEGLKTAKLLQDAKQQIADLLNIRANEVFITSGATEANNLALIGAARAYKNRGNHIITTNIEHASVAKTLAYLQKEGFEITELPVGVDGCINVDTVLAAIRPETILISIMHINNEIGSIQPISEIAEAVKAQNSAIITHSDMAQSIGKTTIDLTHIDLATFSGHKFYAPKSIGLLYKKVGINLEPLFYGGQQEEGLRPGTVNAPLVAALAKAMRLAFERVQNQELLMEIIEKRARILAVLKENSDVRITLNHDDFTRVSPFILHFQVKNQKVQIETYLNALSNAGFCLSTRSTCHSKSLKDANPVLQALGCNVEESRRGLRLSLSHLTTEKEIVAFIATFEKILRELTI